VEVRNDAGAVVPSYTGAVSMRIGANPGGGTLSGHTTVNPVNGVATFADLSIDKAAISYNLVAESPGLLHSTSDAFNINLPPPPPPGPTHLAFTQQPSNTPSGAAISPPIKVEARNDGGGVMLSFTGPITLTIGANPGGGTLSGQTTVNCVNGVATFTDVHIDRPASSYNLKASSPGLLGATSDAFNIGP
jgi:hypothetical protein